MEGGGRRGVRGGEGGKGVTCSSFVHFLMEDLRVGFNVSSQMHVNSMYTNPQNLLVFVKLHIVSDNHGGCNDLH